MGVSFPQSDHSSIMIDGPPTPAPSVAALPTPLPLVDAEHLAAHLYLHAEAARQRHHAIQSKLDAELAREAAARKESQSLLAEFAQYQGWINEDIEGGGAYRLSKDLVEERERRAALEKEVSSLKGRLSELSGTLQDLVRQAKMPTPAATQAKAADDALSNLKKLKALCAPPRKPLLLPDEADENQELQQNDK